MSTTPATYEEYLAELAKKLSWFERLADSATGTDERLDLTNRLLIENLKLLREGLKVQLPPPMFPDLPHYTVMKFLLDTARLAPGDKVDMPGDMITAFTNGTLAETYIRLDSPTADAIPLNEFNPYRLTTGWQKFWLETTSQPGKYLRLHIGRAASAEAQLTSPAALDMPLSNLLGALDMPLSNLLGAKAVKSDIANLSIGADSTGTVSFKPSAGQIWLVTYIKITFTTGDADSFIRAQFRKDSYNVGPYIYSAAGVDLSYESSNQFILSDTLWILLTGYNGAADTKHFQYVIDGLQIR